MNTKMIIAGTALASLMLTTGAFAETDGYPTPINQQAPVSARDYVNTQASEAYPTFAPQLSMPTLSQPVLAQNGGSEAGVEPINGMPKGFDVGTASYSDNQIQSRWFAQQAQRHYASLQAKQQATQIR